MDKKELFKEFAKNHPELINYVNNNDITWQKLYEIYDIYGEDNSVWDKYINNKVNIKDIIKGIDVDAIEEHINNLQKALGVISDLTSKGSDVIGSVKGPISPRPITKFFGD